MAILIHLRHPDALSATRPSSSSKCLREQEKWQGWVWVKLPKTVKEKAPDLSVQLGLVQISMEQGITVKVNVCIPRMESTVC